MSAALNIAIAKLSTMTQDAMVYFFMVIFFVFISSSARSILGPITLYKLPFH